MKKKILCLIPNSYDFLCATIIDGFNQLQQPYFANHATNNGKKENKVSEKDLLECANDCDLIILFSNRLYPVRKQFIIENNLLHKTAYVDGADTSSFVDPLAVILYKSIFKRELQKLRPSLKEKNFKKNRPIRDFRKNINKYLTMSTAIPLPFAAETNYFKYNTENLEKDISVSCLFKEKLETPLRGNILKAVSSLNIPNSLIGAVTEANYNTSSSDIRKDLYYKSLARSKISISSPGKGFDTGRFWEILANKALLFSPPIINKMPHPFIPHQHFIPFSNMLQLKDRLLYFIKHEQEAKEIAECGYQHLLRFHTSKERARYLLKMIECKLKI